MDEERTISWKPIILITLLLIAVLGAGAYFLFFQGGGLSSNTTGVSDAAKYRAIADVLKKADPKPVTNSDFFKSSVQYKFDIPAVPLGNSNPFQ